MTSLTVAVTLQRPDLDAPPATVLLSTNQYGQLPALLIDPIDIAGQIVSGKWLVTQRNEVVVEADYEFIQPMDDQSDESATLA